MSLHKYDSMIFVLDRMENVCCIVFLHKNHNYLLVFVHVLQQLSYL